MNYPTLGFARHERTPVTVCRTAWHSFLLAGAGASSCLAVIFRAAV
jgi:hypothetical protein